MDNSLHPRQQQEQQSKDDKMNNLTHLLYMLVIIFIEYMYRLFIQTPVSAIKAWLKQPISLLILFLILFPVYVLTQCCISLSKLIAKITVIPRDIRILYIINLFFSASKERQQQHQRPSLFDLASMNDNDDDDEDDLHIYLERCSICFDSKLDLCLEYCRDQFCLPCFQRYVTEVVQSSWGLSVTKVKCPVCRIYIPQSEWAKYVPSSTTELYNKFNQPFRSFSRCCSHCATEMAPCDFKRVYERSQSKIVATLIQDFFNKSNLECESEQRLDLIQIKHYIHLFEKMEWRNSTIADIYHQLIQMLLCACQTVNQSSQVKEISLKIMQLEMRPDTWRRLQFDHISLFPNMSCPTCNQEMCLQCGEDSHPLYTCEEKMRQLIKQNEETTTTTTTTGANADYIQTLKWKMENSRKCSSCSIMINRDEGCNKVDCTMCGFSFCWECRSSWSESCSYFVCANDRKITATGMHHELTSGSNNSGSSNDDTSVADLSISDAHSLNNNIIPRAELGVPDVQVIHASRTNQAV